MMDTYQQGEGEIMAVEWATVGLSLGSAHRLKQPNCHQVVPSLLLSSYGWCGALSPGRQVFLRHLCAVAKSKYPLCYYFLNIFLYSAINYFKGNFFKWKYTIYHKWKEALKISTENTEYCYCILATSYLPARLWAWGLPFVVVKDAVKTN